MSEALLRQLKQLVAELEEQETPRPNFDELTNEELAALWEQVAENRRAGRPMYARTRYARHRHTKGEAGGLPYADMTDEELKEEWRKRKERARHNPDRFSGR